MENLNLTDPIQKLIEEKSPVLASYIPTLLLWTFSALLPILVWYGGHLGMVSLPIKFEQIRNFQSKSQVSILEILSVRQIQ